MNRRRIMLIAGEASGDTLGAELVRSLRALSLEMGEPAPLEFFGAGGPALTAEGVDVVVDLTAHAVVGVWEVLRHYRTFRRIFHQLLRLAREREAAAIILIDYPGFNLRFLRAIRRWEQKRHGPFHNWRPRIIYYVSPQLWAWHARRVKQMAADVDLLLTIFPFEPAWYAERAPSLRVQFVGHPIVDRYGPVEENRAPSPVPEPTILLLPGSRVRELARHLPVLADAVKQIAEKTRARFRCVVASEEHAAMARQAFAGLPVETRVGGLPSELGEATVAVAASGTVTVECAWFGVPAVVIYKTSPLTYFLGKRFIKVEYLAMPNLLAGEEIMPELIQTEATGQNIAGKVFSLLNHPQERERIRARLAELRRALGESGASRRAAAGILDLVYYSYESHGRV